MSAHATTPSKTFCGKYRGTVVNNIDPMLRGRLLVMVPGRARPGAVDLGRAVRAAGRPDRTADGRLHGAADRRRRVGRVRAGRSELPDLGRLPLGRAADVPPLALAGLPVSPNIVLQTAGQNTIVISDLPGPDRRHHAQEHDRRDVIVNDTGIYIQNGKGAMITHDRPDGRRSTTAR